MAAPEKTLSRRRFLLSAGAGGATAAAAIAIGRARSGALPQAPGKRSSHGYHASEHVNSYYRSTKI